VRNGFVQVDTVGLRKVAEDLRGVASDVRALIGGLHSVPDPRQACGKGDQLADAFGGQYASMGGDDVEPGFAELAGSLLGLAGWLGDRAAGLDKADQVSAETATDAYVVVSQ
jgi:hypothetical protein